MYSVRNIGVSKQSAGQNRCSFDRTKDLSFYFLSCSFGKQKIKQFCLRNQQREEKFPATSKLFGRGYACLKDRKNICLISSILITINSKKSKFIFFEVSINGRNISVANGNFYVFIHSKKKTVLSVDGFFLNPRKTLREM